MEVREASAAADELDIQQEFRKRARRKLKLAGKTQTYLAGQAGLSQPCVSDFLEGRSELKPETMAKLARALKALQANPDIVAVLAEEALAATG